jgi:hypothetical protein
LKAPQMKNEMGQHPELGSPLGRLGLHDAVEPVHLADGAWWQPEHHRQIAADLQADEHRGKGLIHRLALQT